METSLVAPKKPHGQPPPPPVACRGGGVLAGATGLSVVLLCAGMIVALGVTDIWRSSDFSVPFHTRLVSLVRSGSAQEAAVVVVAAAAASIQQKEEAILSRAQDVAAFINDVTLSKQLLSIGSSSRDVLSPEEQALQWLIKDDPLQLSIDTPSDQFRLIQRYALLTLWFQQFYGHVHHMWIRTTGWLVDVDECHWFGISCEAIDFGGDIRVQNAVTSVFFVWNNVHGTLPADLGLLPSMKEFAIDDFISGTLPSSLGRWTNLQTFVVGGIRLEGTLPTSLERWTNLKTFILDGNVKGTLPSWLGRWTNLEFFDIGGTNLDGTIPSSFGAWGQSIRAVTLGNQQEGTLPNEIASWTELRWFLASWTELTGTLDVMTNWTNLSWLDVSYNQFSGPLPTTIHRWSRLIYLDADMACLTGTIPNEWPDSVQTINLGDNSFTGSLPHLLHRSTRLELFDVSNNALTGTIPDYGALAYAENRGNGSVAAANVWPNLRGPVLSFNQLTGTIPESIGTWSPQMIEVGLSINNLTGSLPSSLELATHLQFFYVNENQLTGTIPSFVGQWTDLQGVAFSNNSFTGSIPQSIEGWSHVGEVNLEGNELVGSIPHGLCQAAGSNLTDLTADCQFKVQCDCCTKCF
jgi:Leucine-rich repeat (LRR) protein